MKKILTFLLMVVSAQMFAQNYPVTSINITLPANPDPNTANWGNGASVFIVNASAKNGSGGIDKLLIESKILVTIKKGGDKVCGSYTSSNAPASNFNTVTKVWSGQNAVSLLGKECILKPGEYTICIQFFGLRGDPLSEEKCRPFSIRGEESQSYQPPQAISPANGSTISTLDAKKPITFRWTPVVPRPRDEVVYKLMVIEVRQGQSPTAAMKSASPIFEKEVVNQTQLVMASLSPYPIAKDSKYGWYVQATNKEGKPFGTNDGTSNPSSFKMGENDIDVSIDTLKVKCCENGKQAIKLTIKNNIDNTTTVLKKIIVTVVNGNSGAPYPMDISAFVSPPLPFSFLPSSTSSLQGRKDFTALINCMPNMKNLVLRAESERNTNMGPVVDTDLETDTLNCICTDCDSLQWSCNLDSIKLSNNQYNLPGNLGVQKYGATLPIFGVEFQVQSYSYSPTPLPCSNGVTSLEESGMLLMPATTINGTSAIQIYSVSVSGSNNNASKSVKLLSTTPLPNPLPVNLTIGLPGAIPGLATDCCVIIYNVCIKTTVYYDREHCKSCTYTKCIEFSNQLKVLL